MSEIPPALLRRLYVEGSLQNRPDGFEFVLRNRLAPSTILGLGPLAVDGKRLTGDILHLQTRKSTRSVTRVSEQAPFDWAINSDIKLLVTGSHLAPGKHALAFGLFLKETGTLTLRVEDDLPAAGAAPG